MHNTGDTGNSLAAQKFDVEGGLYYYRARYYDTNSGRFLSEDPIGFSGGINFYEYAGNAPTMLVDPTGFQKSSWASQLDDLLDWAGGTWVPSGSYHSNDPVTRDLSKSPAMQEIRDKYKKAGCEPGLYCGEFHFGQIFTTANLVIQTVGSFCAYLSIDVDGDLQVDAFNEWGLKSLTADFAGHRRSPSLWKHGDRREVSSFSCVAAVIRSLHSLRFIPGKS